MIVTSREYPGSGVQSGGRVPAAQISATIWKSTVAAPHVM